VAGGDVAVVVAAGLLESAARAAGRTAHPCAGGHA
jgi:hypothetical protein